MVEDPQLLWTTRLLFKKLSVDTLQDGSVDYLRIKAGFKSFVVGMLGDVGGKTAKERATSAAAIAPTIADTFFPLAYGLGGPNMSREQSLEGLNTIVKGLNIATGGSGEFIGKLTRIGGRVFGVVALAKATDPNLGLGRIRTTLANLKTAAFTMSSESLARLLSSGGDRGVRVANEVYQAMRSLSGIVDNKAGSDSCWV